MNVTNLPNSRGLAGSRLFMDSYIDNFVIILPSAPSSDQGACMFFFGSRPFFVWLLSLIPLTPLVRMSRDVAFMIDVVIRVFENVFLGRLTTR